MAERGWRAKGVRQPVAGSPEGGGDPKRGMKIPVQPPQWGGGGRDKASVLEARRVPEQQVRAN